VAGESQLFHLMLLSLAILRLKGCVIRDQLMLQGKASIACGLGMTLQSMGNLSNG